MSFQYSYTFAVNTKSMDKVALFKITLNFFKNSFFPLTVTEWNKLDPNFWNEIVFTFFKYFAIHKTKIKQFLSFP